MATSTTTPRPSPSKRGAGGLAAAGWVPDKYAMPGFSPSASSRSALLSMLASEPPTPTASSLSMHESSSPLDSFIASTTLLKNSLSATSSLSLSLQPALVIAGEKEYFDEGLTASPIALSPSGKIPFSAEPHAAGSSSELAQEEAENLEDDTSSILDSFAQPPQRGPSMGSLPPQEAAAPQSISLTSLSAISGQMQRFPLSQGSIGSIRTVASSTYSHSYSLSGDSAATPSAGGSSLRTTASSSSHGLPVVVARVPVDIAAIAGASVVVESVGVGSGRTAAKEVPTVLVESSPSTAQGPSKRPRNPLWRRSASDGSSAHTGSSTSAREEQKQRPVSWGGDRGAVGAPVRPTAARRTRSGTAPTADAGSLFLTPAAAAARRPRAATASLVEAEKTWLAVPVPSGRRVLQPPQSLAGSDMQRGDTQSSAQTMRTALSSLSQEDEEQEVEDLATAAPLVDHRTSRSSMLLTAPVSLPPRKLGSSLPDAHAQPAEQERPVTPSQAPAQERRRSKLGRMLSRAGPAADRAPSQGDSKRISWNPFRQSGKKDRAGAIGLGRSTSVKLLPSQLEAIADRLAGDRSVSGSSTGEDSLSISFELPAHLESCAEQAAPHNIPSSPEKRISVMPPVPPKSPLRAGRA